MGNCTIRYGGITGSAKTSPAANAHSQFAMAFEAQSRRSERFPTSAPHVGPVGVLVIDYKSVRMTHPIAGADSTQRVGMSCWQVRVFVFEDLWVSGRPDH